MNEFIKIIPNTCWYVRFNPEGGGLALCVPRGIPCEGHTQVFSAHCTNNPDAADVMAEIDSSAKYGELIDAFCALMQSIEDWDAKECLGAVFCVWLIKKIADGAENRWYERLEAEKAKKESQ